MNRWIMCFSSSLLRIISLGFLIPFATLIFFSTSSLAFDFTDFASITVNGKKIKVLEEVGLGNKEEAGSNNDPAKSKLGADSNNSPENEGITRVAGKGAEGRPKWCDEEKKKYEEAKENYDRLRAKELKSIPTFGRDASTAEIIAAMGGSPNSLLNLSVCVE